MKTIIPQKILTPTLDKEYKLTLSFLTKEELEKIDGQEVLNVIRISLGIENWAVKDFRITKVKQ